MNKIPRAASVIAARVVGAADAKEAEQGIGGTPAFFVNGRYLSGAQPVASFKSLIDQAIGKPVAPKEPGVTGGWATA